MNVMRAMKILSSMKSDATSWIVTTDDIASLLAFYTDVKNVRLNMDQASQTNDVAELSALLTTDGVSDNDATTIQTMAKNITEEYAKTTTGMSALLTQLSIANTLKTDIIKLTDTINTEHHDFLLMSLFVSGYEAKQPNICTKTNDPTNSSFIKGTITFPQNTSRKQIDDTCADDNTVQEYLCTNGIYDTTDANSSKPITCSYGCYLWACQKTPPSSTGNFLLIAPDTATIGQDYIIKIKTVDAHNQPTTNYTGRVLVLVGGDDDAVRNTALSQIMSGKSELTFTATKFTKLWTPTITIQGEGMAAVTKTVTVTATSTTTSATTANEAIALAAQKTATDAANEIARTVWVLQTTHLAGIAGIAQEAREQLANSQRLAAMAWQAAGVQASADQIAADLTNARNILVGADDAAGAPVAAQLKAATDAYSTASDAAVLASFSPKADSAFKETTRQLGLAQQSAANAHQLTIQIRWVYDNVVTTSATASGLAGQTSANQLTTTNTLQHLCDNNTTPASLFIIAGQSNAVGLGRISDIQGQAFWKNWGASGFNFKFWETSNLGRNDTSWQDGSQVGNQIIQGQPLFGVEVPLAMRLQQSGQKNFYIFKAAWAASSLGASQPTNDWLTRWAGKHYDDMLASLRNAETQICSAGYRPVVQGIYWMQGESDTDTAGTQSYAGNLKTLVDQLTADVLVGSARIIIGKIKIPPTWAMSDSSFWTSIRASQDTMNGYAGRVLTIDTNDLTYYNADCNVDSYFCWMHYDATGIMQMGDRVFNALVQ